MNMSDVVSRAEEIVDAIDIQEPRTLLWDIETAPNLGYTWAKWEQNVIDFKHEWYVLTIAWKWLGEDKVNVAGLDDFVGYEKDREDDYALVALAHDLFDEADIVVAHNGIAFDTKKIQARMLIHGFDPPSQYKEVDTLKIARRHFAFTSNKLGDLCQTLGIGTKEATGGFETWKGCMNNDPKSWARMKKYNKHDVVILEELYLRLRPWANNLPNLATMSGRPDACPKCGAEDGMIRRGYYPTAVCLKVKLQCKACGGYSRSRVSERSEAKYI